MWGSILKNSMLVWILILGHYFLSPFYIYLVIFSITMFNDDFFIFFSGMVAEHVNLRYYISIGMILSGVSSYLFGLGKVYNIHAMRYFLAVQVINFLLSVIQEQRVRGQNHSSKLASNLQLKVYKITVYTLQ